MLRSSAQGLSWRRSVMRRASDQPERPEMRQRYGRAGAQSGKIEKATDPRRALLRLALYLSPYKVALTLVLLFVLIYTLLGLVEPYMIGQSIDRFISTKQAAGLLPFALLLLVLYLIDNAFQAASSWT